MAEIENKKYKCKQEGCTVSTDGKCLEGLNPDDCTHCSVEDDEIMEEVTISDDIEEDQPDEEEFHNVHLGEALELNETACVTNSSLTRLILLAGLSDAGKTTMLASLYDLFQSSGNYCGYTFSGSKTLIGFEKRCHDARIKSRRVTPATERTKYTNSPVFLHLKVKDEENISTDLLFTDISGEKFKDLSNSTLECENFGLAKRADHFALFIDSHQLSDFTQRNIVKTRSIGIIRSLIEAKMLDVNTYIEIIFSRWDLLKEKQEQEVHLQFVENLKNEILSKFSDSLKNITYFNLASRPKRLDGFEFGYGIDNIFPDWVEKSVFFHNHIDRSKSLNSFKPVREFSRYKFI